MVKLIVLILSYDIIYKNKNKKQKTNKFNVFLCPRQI